MISTIFWVAVGIVIKTLIPMPYVDVVIRNVWAKCFGLAQEFYTPVVKPAVTTTTTTKP